MTIDTQSPPGSWRQELLKTAASTTRLREIVSELEHCLKVSRQEAEALREKNNQLVSQLAEATALQMEALGKNEKLKQEIDHIWKVIRGVSND